MINSDIEFEVRTTIHTDLLDENDINIIVDTLYKKGYKNTYYLQNFFDTQKETIGNIKPQKRKLDITKINKIIPIEFRNF